MRNALKVFCAIAFLGLVVNAQSSDFVWKNSSFGVPPTIVLDAANVPNGGVLTSSSILLPGSVSGSNTLLSTYISNGKFTIFRQLLNVFDGSVLATYDPIVTSMTGVGVRYTATLDGWFALGDVETDSNGFSQIFLYKMLLNGTQIERVAATDNNDNSISYRLLSLFNDNINFIVAYEEGTTQSGQYQGSKMLINKLNILDDSIGTQFPVTNGAVDFASCDSIAESSTAYCIFKQDSNTRGAILSITNAFSQSPVNILSDSDTITYSPLFLAGVNGYYVALMTAKTGNQVSLVGRIVATSYGPTTINKWTISNDFESFSIMAVTPYYNGFMIFYSIVDASNNQEWYYEAFDENFGVEFSPTLIASVPSTYMLSSFSVAQSSLGGSPSDSYRDSSDSQPLNTANGNPLGFMAVQASAGQTFYAWYGQIMNQTIDTSMINSSGYIMKPLMVVASLILGLLMI